MSAQNQMAGDKQRKPNAWRYIDRLYWVIVIIRTYNFKLIEYHPRPMEWEYFNF